MNRAWCGSSLALPPLAAELKRAVVWCAALHNGSKRCRRQLQRWERVRALLSGAYRHAGSKGEVRTRGRRGLDVGPVESGTRGTSWDTKDGM